MTRILPVVAVLGALTLSTSASALMLCLDTTYWLLEDGAVSDADGNPVDDAFDWPADAAVTFDIDGNLLRLEAGDTILSQPGQE